VRQSNPFITNGEDGARLEWETQLHLLRNRFAWWDVLRVIALVLVSLVVGVGLFSYLISGRLYLIAYQYILLATAILYVPFVLIGIISGDRLRATFKLDRFEAAFDIVPDTRLISRLARKIAPLAGGWRPLAPALFHLHPELVRISWDEVYKLTFFPAEGVITLSDTWRSVVRIYASETHYDAVCRYCRDRLAVAEQNRAGRTQRRKPMSFYIILTIACLGAVLATQVWRWADYGTTHAVGILAGLVAVFMVFTWLAWWSNLVAVLTMVLGSWYLVSLWITAVGPLTGGFRYLVDLPRFGLACLGGVFLLGLSLARWLDTGMET